MQTTRRQFLVRALSTAAVSAAAPAFIGCTQKDADQGFALVQAFLPALEAITSVVLAANGLGYISPVVLPAFQKVLDTSKIVASNLITAYSNWEANRANKNTAQRVVDVARDFRQSIQAIMTVSDIADPATLTAYMASANAILGLLDAILMRLPPDVSKVTARNATMIALRVRRRKDFTREFNMALAGGGYQRYSIK